MWFSLIFLSACSAIFRGREEPARFPVRGIGASLAASGRDAAAGTLDFSKPKKLEYRFGTLPPAPSPASLEIEYDFSVPPSAEIKDMYQLVLKTGEDAWALPMDLSFLGMDAAGAVIHYAVPLTDAFSGQFSLSLGPANSRSKKKPSPPGPEGLPRFRIRSLEIKERWFGYYESRKEEDGGDHRFTTPFVFKQESRYVLDPSLSRSVTGNPNMLPEILVDFVPGKTAVLETGRRRVEALPDAEYIRVPAAVLSAKPGPVAVSGDRFRAFQLTYSEPLPFPRPIEADPGMAIGWPREQWRDSRYELFRWDQFPSLLIFDTGSYAIQDRMLKRLAFFVEKAGFRGRLAPDDEIAGLHGWNAHDYRAEDLARFFEAARVAEFPLLDEERELERILRNEGIIRAGGSGGITAGEGGIISISRESNDYLRSLFLVHEGFHGLFFIDPDFREFSRRRWERLSAPAKRFIISYFDYQHYDIKDEYLMVNEFMAHILQQPAVHAADYFGKTLASRLESSSWRRAALPPKEDASGTWPLLAQAFTREAEAFSAYVSQRWGLAAGRVSRLTLR